LSWYLTFVPHAQDAARQKVLRVLGADAEPSVTVDSIQAHFLPFLTACIRETIHINPPKAYTTPRISPVDVTLEE
ncbi:hypothetical protein EDB19DRAFT_1607612, partial [Suillus lakei]